MKMAGQELSISTFFFILICFVSSRNEETGLGYNRYHDYKNLSNFLQAFANEHPQLTRLHSIGNSVMKRKLWVMEVHPTNMPIVLGVPHVKIIGNIHGNEPAGREIILHLIEYLVTKYENGDEYIQWLVNNTRISLLPSLNPDGFEQSIEGRCNHGSHGGRVNSRGYDLNRNFPDYFKKNTLESQPETEAVKAWMWNNTFVLSASLHGGSMVANYPFDNIGEEMRPPILQNTPESLTPDDDVFIYLAKMYAKTHPTMHKAISCEKGSRTFKDGIVNGASWYAIKGGMQDYNYFEHGCMELTLEMSCCKYPPASELKGIWNENLKALLMFIAQSQRGVRGIVTDEENRPIPRAVVKIVRREITFNTSKDGEFWRVLLPGHYYIQVEAVGYQPLTDFLFIVPEVKNEMMPRHTRLNLKLKSLVTNSGTTVKAVSEGTTTSEETTILASEMVTSTVSTTTTIMTGSSYKADNLREAEIGASTSAGTVHECTMSVVVLGAMVMAWLRYC